MTVETIKLQLTKPALERLIEGEPGIELALKKDVCREIVEKHFKSLATDELWNLSHAMSEHIAKEVAKVVEGFVSGSKDPTGRYKWFINHPTCLTVEQMIATACQKYFTEECSRLAVKAAEDLAVGSETIDKMIERKVKSAMRVELDRMVQKHVDDQLGKCLASAGEKISQIKLNLTIETASWEDF